MTNGMGGKCGLTDIAALFHKLHLVYGRKGAYLTKAVL